MNLHTAWLTKDYPAENREAALRSEARTYFGTECSKCTNNIRYLSGECKRCHKERSNIADRRARGDDVPNYMVAIDRRLRERDELDDYYGEVV